MNGFNELIHDSGIYVGDVTDKNIERCLSQLRGYKQLLNRQFDPVCPHHPSSGGGRAAAGEQVMDHGMDIFRYVGLGACQ